MEESKIITLGNGMQKNGDETKAWNDTQDYSLFDGWLKDEF